jgi:ABC-type amino acid transport substrate-binding protein
MNPKKYVGRLASLAIAILAVLAVTACGGGSSGSSDGGGNLLQEVKDRGTLRVSTDPVYPPQSFQDNQGEFKGFDIDVAEEIAKRMGVEV